MNGDSNRLTRGEEPRAGVCGVAGVTIRLLLVAGVPSAIAGFAWILFPIAEELRDTREVAFGPKHRGWYEFLSYTHRFVGFAIFIQVVAAIYFSGTGRASVGHAAGGLLIGVSVSIASFFIAIVIALEIGNRFGQPWLE